MRRRFSEEGEQRERQHIVNRRQKRRREKEVFAKKGEKIQRGMSISQHWVVRTSTGIAILFKVAFLCTIEYFSFSFEPPSGDGVVSGCDNHIFVDGHNPRSPTIHAG